ncbi:DNA polymerase III subunit gamma and tau [Bifidobacterium sp. CP2]|uniref:DNA polymerase III subunit gamma and tau n=1 Tax=Bifidobacterium sp. CP2 TaxID=2809025 RepID=UPI001BDC1883|nr:DNA polymerase III subunit gamma and tau [Bifidobacterium sp. CP2]MBT1182359.1 DNA polymerase III subunit gamma and tau [Bifidobacterium sp. CP2]
MALALYRRYRPDTFEGVIGQDQVTVPLMRALDEGKLTHAYLFSGPRGCGKTSSARILARCVNCAKGPTSHPCGECESCKDLATGGPGSIDVVEIDAASHNGVDDARELRERAGFAPARDRYKIFILDEAHMVTPQGFNALLKIVEEPPEHVMFIFATTEPDKVIGTIRSRTHHYPFRLVPAEVMGPYLEKICEDEHIKTEPGVLKLAMRAGGGSVRDTLSVLDQLMVGAVDGVITHDASVALLGFTPEALIGEAVDAVIDKSGEKLYGVIQKVVVGGFDPRRFVEDLLARVRDLLVLTLAGDRAESVLSDTAEAEEMGDLHRQAAALGLGPLTAMADIINDTLGSMTGAISPRMRLELLAARLLAGAERGFVAAPAAQAGGVGPSVPGTSVEGAAGNGTSGAGARGNAHGGFAGAARNTGGFAGSARNQHAVQSGGGFAGAERNHQTAASPSGNTGDTTPHAADASAPRRPNTDTAHAAQQPAQPATSAPSATAQTTAQQAQQSDTRTTDQRWDALVASLPADVRAYVDRTKVPRVLLKANTNGRQCLWIKFDKPLNKYAFAMAVAGEPVDGATSVVDILRAKVREVFGKDVSLAPTKKMADGQMAPPLSKLPETERQRIKAQLLQENLRAATAKLQTEEKDQGTREPAASPASEPSAAADDDDSHRGTGASESPAGTASAGAAGAEPSADSDAATSAPTATSASSGSADDDADPWATPVASAPAKPGAAADDPSHAGRAERRDERHEGEHHHKHVAVPDLSDDTDPWAQPASRPASQASAGAAPDDPWNTPVRPMPTQPMNVGGAEHAAGTANVPNMVNATNATNAARPQSSVRSAPPQSAPADPWQHAASPAAQDDPWKDVPPPTAPDDPWNTPVGPVPSRPMNATAAQSAPAQPSPVADDPWNMPQAGRQDVRNVPQGGIAPQGAAAPPAGPQVDADEDEYSMDDESLGVATAMSVDDLRKLFEVKKVEEFAADDPHNPRNIHAAPKHDE